MIELERSGPAAILRLHGSYFGDTETVELDRTLERLHAEGVRRLAIDFARVKAFNSVALGVLIKAVVRIKPEGGRMVLFGFVGRTLPAFRPPASLYGALWSECATQEEALAQLEMPATS